MSAASYDIVVERYANWAQEFVWIDDTGKAVNLTGKTGKLQVRKSAESEDVLLELVPTLGGVAGTVLFEADEAETALWDFGSGVYDVVIGEDRFIEGKFRVKPGVTKP